MWVIALAIVNLSLFAAAAGSLILSAGCEWVGCRHQLGWLRGVAASLRWAARAFTVLLVLAVLGSVVLLAVEFLR